MRALLSISILLLSLPVKAQLEDIRILLVPAHGLTKVFDGNGNFSWSYQRTLVQGGVREDLKTPDFVAALKPKLEAMGATVYSSRELSKNVGNGGSGFPIWMEASKYFLESKGSVPRDIWEYTPDNKLRTEEDHDINARWKYAEYLGVDLALNIHTNAGLQPNTGGGTEVFYANSGEHSSIHGLSDQSERLADAIFKNTISLVRNSYEPSWQARPDSDEVGAKPDNFREYGEISFALTPSALIEVAFHDVTSRGGKSVSDVEALNDPVFIEIVAHALRDGILEYYSIPKIGLEAYESNDSIQTATNISLNSKQLHFLSGPDDRDVIEFNTSSVSNISVDVDGLRIGAEVQLLDENSNLIKSKEISEHPLDRIEFLEILNIGKHYINVSDSGFTRPQGYTVEVRNEGGCLLSKTSTIATPDKQSVQSQFFCDSQVSTPEPITPSGPNNGTSHIFSWTKIPETSRYELYVYSLDGSSSKLSYFNKTITSNSFRVPSFYLEEGESYYWIVRAVGNTGILSSYSSRQHFNISTSPSGDTEVVLYPPVLLAPGSPIELSIDNLDPTLYWAQEENASRYELYISEGHQVIYRDTHISNSQNTYKVPKGVLTNNQSYSWYMISVDSSGQESEYSSVLNFRTNVPDEGFSQLSLDRYLIDDNNLGDSRGDNDKRVEIGEIVELDLYLKNTGNKTARRVEVFLSEESSCVSIRRNRVERTSIEVGGIEKFSDFILEIKQCVDGTVVPFGVYIRSDEGTWTETLSIPIYDNSISQADLNYTDHQVEDDDRSLGNDNGKINVGETIELHVEITNEGEEKAENVLMDISSDSSCLDIEQRNITFALIGVGSSRKYSYEVKVDGDCDETQADIGFKLTSLKSSWHDIFKVEILPNDKRPDLLVAATPVLNKPEVEELRNNRVEVEIKNVGDLRSEETRVTYFLSDDADIDSDDIDIGSDQVKELDPNGVTTEAKAFQVLSGVGTFYIGACIETVAGEQISSNNCSTGIPMTVFQRTSLDLVITQSSVAENFPYVGQFIDYSYTVVNAGSEGSDETEVDRFFSIDINESIVDGDKDLPPLDSNQSYQISGDFQVPYNTGAYWLRHCVRPEGRELNLINNCSSPMRVNVRQKTYDLTMVSGISLNFPNPEAGQRVEASARAGNISGDPSDSTRVFFYLSYDSDANSLDESIGSDFLPERRVGKSSGVEIDFNVPFQDGKYWVIGCIEPTDLESNSMNNCSKAHSFYVGDMPQDENPDEPDLCFPVVTSRKNIAILCL